MCPAYLWAHLQRELRMLDKYQLLWRFYIEYLTLAVGNAKSHPVLAGGKHESAIAFLTDLKEKLEVSQVQLEIFHVLSPRLQLQPSDSDLWEKVELLERGLFSITELYQVYADPHDLLTIKLLALCVSQHQDEALVKDIWDCILHEAVQSVPSAGALDHIQGTIVPLG
ncbi:hypothetical protein BJV78DRAFT_1334295 [Lactifluus subvellereus]|nr:hypothetical protein BJV78DRAFT_1334295 [Lactifluus subvellereus]